MAAEGGPGWEVRPELIDQTLSERASAFKNEGHLGKRASAYTLYGVSHLGQLRKHVASHLGG